jgi:hypothetical protein
MSESMLLVEKKVQARRRSELDIDVLVERVWLDLGGKVPRSAIEPIVSQLLSNYENAKVKQYLPVIVQRQAKQLLQKR